MQVTADIEKVAAGLVDEMAGMTVIDAHEHLPSEEEAVAETADVFTRIYCHYSITNAVSAGMPVDRLALRDTDRPLDERWAIFRPFLPAIRDTGYARAAQIAARELYGIDDINDDTYAELSDRLQAANIPGLYDSVLKDRCRIERVLNQGSWDAGPRGYAVQVHRGFMDFEWALPGAVRTLYERWCEKHEGEFADPSEWVDFWLRDVTAQGSVGLKFHAEMPTGPVDDADAASLFGKLQVGALADDEARVLGTWMMHKAIEFAPDHGLVVAVHCGIIYRCWQDFTRLNPVNMIPLLMRFRRTRFDLYHGGIPWVREMAVIGNQYPNAHLNLIWCHQISPYMAEQMLNEWIDLVPVNKVIGFGGDNTTGPEKTYGVLKMAQENIARALAVRVVRGQMTESRAVGVCRAWLYENPKRIYGLDAR
jgi:predicted TIM-barrel fold metal-dependent hydrolase